MNKGSGTSATLIVFSEFDVCKEVDNDLEQAVEKDKKKFILLRWKDDSFAKLVFHTDLLQARRNMWDSPTSWNNNQAAFLDRLVSAGSKNGFRVLADDAKIGRTGAKYLIIFGARQRRLLPAHPRARGNIIPPSPRRVLSEVVRRGDGEKGIFCSPPSLSPPEEGYESYDRRGWMFAHVRGTGMHFNFIADG